MDFTKLQGLSDNMKLSPEEKYLRRSLYIIFANTCVLEKLYIDVLVEFKKYISTNLIQQQYDKDILYSFFKSVEYVSTMKEQGKINLNVEVYSCPLLPAINIPPSLKISQQLLTNMNCFGYQHLDMVSDITDTSESLNLDISGLYSDAGDSVLLEKEVKTCQKAIEANCESILEPRMENSVVVAGITVHVDILIFVDKETICRQLADYLGLIYVEGMLEDFSRGINTILFGLNKKRATLYKLIQSYINKQLLDGRNNICLVHHLSLWMNFSANVRAVVSTETLNISVMEAVGTANFHVKLGEHASVLDYVESISVIIDKALNSESHVITKYECEESCYRIVKLPLISIIPLHILRYFRLCRIVEQNVKL